MDVDVVSVSKIAAMLAKATEQHQPALPGVADARAHGARFARHPDEYTPHRRVHLTLVPGGVTDQGDPQ